MDGKMIELAITQERLRIALILVRHMASLETLTRSAIPGFTEAWFAAMNELLAALECRVVDTKD